MPILSNAHTLVCNFNLVYKKDSLIGIFITLYRFIRDVPAFPRLRWKASASKVKANILQVGKETRTACIKGNEIKKQQEIEKSRNKKHKAKGNIREKMEYLD